MTKANDTIPDASQQNQGGQQQYTQPVQPKKSSNTVLIIVVVVIVVFGVLPLIALLFLGNIVNNFLNSKGGEEFVATVISEIRNSGSGPEQDVSGVWNCRGEKKISGLEEEYTSTITMDANKQTFKYGKYGDLANNSYSGKYDARQIIKSDTKYKYYKITFSDVDLIEDGVYKEAKGLQDLEMAIVADKGDEASIMFSGGNTYYCEK